MKKQDDLDQLLRDARAADGSWWDVILDMMRALSIAEPDARHIANMTPRTTIGLIERLERAEAIVTQARRVESEYNNPVRDHTMIRLERERLFDVLAEKPIQ